MKLSTLMLTASAISGAVSLAVLMPSSTVAAGNATSQDIPETSSEPQEREELQRPPNDRQGNPRGAGDRGERGGRGLPSRLLAEAQNMMQGGRCAEAIPIFACFANRGRGYEIAQLSLAQCLTRTAETLEDGPEKTTQGQQALFWADRAASFGDASAQGFLAYHYAAGEITTPNGRQAAKWLALFLQNPRYVNLGFGKLPTGTEQLVGAVANNADRQFAAGEANAWRELYEVSPAPEAMLPAEDCPTRRRRGDEEDNFEENPDERSRQRTRRRQPR